jgi:Icc-related predicted phosphoesterase
MRAICIADVHGDLSTLIKLRNSISGGGFTHVFILGDFSQGHKNPDENRMDIIRMVKTFSEYKVKAIPGNCDQLNSISMFDELGINLHNTVIQLPEASIIGFGGSNATPFGTPFELAEEDIERRLRDLFSMVDSQKRVIFMSHAPPKDTNCDVIAKGLHVGSSAIRKIIEEKQPDLVLCSHIHESGGIEDKIGKSRVINIGRVSDGRAYALTVTDSLEIELYIG